MESKSLWGLLRMFLTFMRVEGYLGRVLAPTSFEIASESFLQPSSPLPVASLRPCLRFKVLCSQHLVFGPGLFDFSVVLA